MNCKLCRDRLQDYLDAMLEADEQAQVSAHLDECVACRRELEELRKVVALVGSLDEVPEPTGFLQAVRERIDTPTVWERIRGLLTQPPRPGVSVAIPVIIIAFVGVFLLTTLLPKSNDQKAGEAAPEPNGEKVAMELERLRDKLKADGDNYAYDSRQSPDEAGGAGGGNRLEGADGPANGFAKEGRRTWGADGATVGELNGDERGEVLDGVGTDSVGRANPRSGLGETGGKQRESLEEEADSTAGTSSLGVAGGREDETRTREAGDGLGKAARNGSSITTTANDDVGDAEAVEQEENGEPVFAGSIRGPHRAEREKQEFQLQAGDEAMDLIVLDGRTDVMSAEKIAREQGGHVIVQRDRELIRGLLLYVPDKNFDKAVEALHLYNDQNRQALERRRAAVAKDAESGPQTLRLIIRRFIEGMDNQ